MFSDSKRKFERLLGGKLNKKGYIIGKEKVMSIRDLSYFANKEKRFAKDLSEGMKRGIYYSSRCRNNDISNWGRDRLYQSIY